MRRQDWAFIAAIVFFAAGIVALFRGALLWAILWVLASALAGIAARIWSVRRPGPMSHRLSGVLAIPRGPLTPRRLVQLLEVAPGERILDVGAGTGIYSLEMARAAAPSGGVAALDIQEEMLRKLRRRATAGDVHNIGGVVADAAKLPYADASFDGIVLVTVHGEIPDRDAAAKEFRRVIKPGGRLVIGETIFDPDYVALAPLIEEVSKANFVLDRKTGSPLAYFAQFRPR